MQHRIGIATFCLIAALIELIGLRAAVAQPPNVTHSSPAGFPAGMPTDVTLYGANLASASGLWTSFPAKVELAPGVAKNGEEAGKIVYRITPQADVSVGLVGLRYATKNGVSNLRLLLIDELPTVADNGKNNSKETAQELTFPAAVDGTVEAESYDYYKFAAKKAQRVSVEVYAQRIGSALDPTVRLLNEQGRELAYSDDEGGIGADSRFSMIIPDDGTYLLEIRDITYQGGGSHRYRLRLGDFPIVNTAFPVAVQRGTQAKVSLTGPAVDDATLDVAMPAEAGGGLTRAVKFSSGDSAAPVAVFASDVKEFTEQEPNNEIKDATQVALPGGFSGRFEQAGDFDFYRFEAKKGEKVTFVAQTRSVGAPTAVFLRVFDADGKQLAEAEDPILSETRLEFTPPADGVFLLRASEALRFFGPEYAYRIDARPFSPGFSLAVDTEQLNVPKGGVFVAKVTVARRGYDGAIQLEITNAPADWKITGNVIPEKKNETTLNVTVPQSIEPGKLLELAVVGKAEIGEQEVIEKADTTAAVKKVFPGLRVAPPDVVGTLGLGVGPEFPKFFEIAAASKAVEFPQVIAAANLKITAKRLNKFPEAVSLKVEGLPEGVKANAPAIAKGKGDAVIAFTGPADLPTGEHKVTITGTATFQNQPQEFVIGDVVLEVVPPLAVAIQPAGPIAVGGKQKLKVSLTRYGGEKAVVAVELKNLPAGVTGPKEIKIAGDKNETEIELTAAADAKPAKAEKVQAVAKAKIKEKDVIVESPPAVIEVQPGGAP